VTPRKNVDLVSLCFAILIVYMAECSRQENEGDHYGAILLVYFTLKQYMEMIDLPKIDLFYILSFLK
jgi:hypothetical protein